MNDTFWKVEGVKGPSTATYAKDMIEILSFNQGASSAEFGKSVQRDFTITKYLDKTTPDLHQLCSTKAAIKKMEIQVWNTDSKKPLKILHYKFETCKITSFDLGAGGSRPMETVRFSFEKMSMGVTVQKVGGGSGGNVVSITDLGKGTHG